MIDSINGNPATDRPQLVFERTYRASVRELWDLWTTKEGFESWWPPAGIRAEVHSIDARLNGELRYDMIAESPEALAVMKQLGMPISHPECSRFSEFQPMEHLVIAINIDFVPSISPYEGSITVDFYPEGESVRMVIALSPMHDADFTSKASQGMTSQVANIDRLFQGRIRS